ncbi:GTPase HflX [Candidatus Uhrbacteria bacterium]|nr:GTPase HflX [Candidatus Uhrbacteria bacterium]
MHVTSRAPRAILIDVIPPDMDRNAAAWRITELESLTRTFGGIVVVKLLQKRSQPDYRTYVGKGKLDEIVRIAKEERADLLIVNNLLKPKQLFALEEALRPHAMAAWDRVDLILKIFQKHASTAEAKLQIRLAAIKHMGPRIFGMGMELSQQAGGIGTRGIGETNTEIMKRHLADQERQVKKELEKAARSRGVHRARRERLGLPTASIVGYTNAGKSSLLNALTRKGAFVADALFATLDTRVSKLWLPSDAPDEMPKAVLLSDTIGFIQDLPPSLVSAFRSTLDETVEADLLLHVIDAGDAHLHEKIAEVEDILRQLGVTETPRIYVFNKMDTAPDLDCAALTERYTDMTPAFVSCLDGRGLDGLKRAIADRL